MNKYFIKLQKDKNYIKLAEEYNKKAELNINLLKKVLEENCDLLIIFIKMNIVIYSKEFNKIKITNKKLKDKYEHNNIEFTTDDIDLVFKYYYKDQKFYISCIKEIIDKRLLEDDIKEILKVIITIDNKKSIILN